MGFGLFSFAALLGLVLDAAVTAADKSTVTYEWRVTYISSACDGVSLTEYGINGNSSSLAVIEVELGQTVQVAVTNELDEPTCLHWHGLQQLGTQEMDGTSDITQCAIAAGGSAVYTFTPERAGTFWWHSHHSTQYAYGLRGALIVHAPADEQQSWEQEVAAEYTLQFADLYHALPGIVPMWDSMIINSLGRYNCTAAASHGYSECNTDQPLSRFKFEAGSKYRLRLINMGALAPFDFSIDGHEFAVVAADGEYLQPSDEITTLRINAGQRYDIIVEAKAASSSSTGGSFWIRATGLYGLPWTAGTASIAGDGFNYEGLAIVYYDEDDTDEPTSSDWTETTTIEEFAFTPLETAVLPTVPSDRAILEFDFRRGLGYFSIDGADYLHFAAPEEPPLFTIAAGLKTEELPATALARKIEYGKHIEVVLVNDMNEQHPFHMHTHSPWVVGSGAASLSDIQAGNLNLKLDGAMKRDVYTVPPCDTDASGACTNHGYVVLRFTADNPGVWIIHCHIDWHLDAGLAMILVEGEDELQAAGADAFANSILSVCGTPITNSTSSNSTA
ncbi:ferroxidase fet3 [Phytophthora pseudosyringae]|uniref:Ferroxidase fet3 n=1 Tax=Phytophthora pseudosyringae TaxID=221518 RepID=A0A8T1V7J1_9STRA|nr:ferroxidase fet3 [Phytophthora pseudosyringae]